MKYIILILTIAFSGFLHAGPSCKGQIKSIYKWDSFETLSIRLSLENGNITNYISLPSKSDESLALMAYASKTEVHVFWSDETVTQCTNGWAHNTKLKGYLSIGD